MFGFLVTIPGSSSWIYLKFVYSLIFTLFNSSQGFHIFLVYIIVSKKRHEMLKSKLANLTVKHLKEFKQRVNSFQI